MVSPLLGPLEKPIFEILYRAAYRACIQLEPNIQLNQFSLRVVRLAKDDKLKIEMVEKEQNLYLVENLVWLEIISANQDLKAVKQADLSRLLYVNHVKGTFILINDIPPRWSFAQVSEGARIKAQANLQNKLAQAGVESQTVSSSISP